MEVCVVVRRGLQRLRSVQGTIMRGGHRAIYHRLLVRFSILTMTTRTRCRSVCRGLLRRLRILRLPLQLLVTLNGRRLLILLMRRLLCSIGRLQDVENIRLQRSSACNIHAPRLRIRHRQVTLMTRSLYLFRRRLTHLLTGILIVHRHSKGDKSQSTRQANCVLSDCVFRCCIFVEWAFRC